MFQRALAACRNPTDRFRNRRAIAGFFFFLFLVFLVPEGIFVSWRGTYARDVTTADKLYERYFGIDETGDFQIRNIAVIDGTLTTRNWLTASLYSVQSGSVENFGGYSVGRSTNRIGEPVWLRMHFTLALGDAERPTGRLTQLCTAGQHRGGGSVSEKTHDIEVVAKKTLPGRLWSGYEYLLYIEGDRPFHAQRTMSVAEFAAANEGNFLVVVVRIN